MPSLLPLDLLEVVIGNFANDHALLLQFSLLGRDFVRPCRKHIFASVVLSESSCNRFCTILESNPYIATCVNELHIRVENWVYRSLSGPAFRIPAVLKLITRGATLKVFTLEIRLQEGLAWHEYSDDVKASITELLKCPSLRVVRLSDIGHNDFPVSILTANPRLKHLGLFYDFRHHLFIRNNDHITLLPPSTKDTGAQPLQTLEFGNETSVNLINALCAPASRISLSGLKHMVLHSGSEPMFRAANHVCHLGAGTIDQVSWIRPLLPTPGAQWRSGDPPPSYRTINFSVLDSARFVTVYLERSLNGEDLSALCACGLPPNIEGLTFVIEACNYRLQLRSAFWINKDLQLIFGAGRYRQLRSIKLRFIDLYEIGAHEQEGVKVEDLFPALCALGIVEVSYEQGNLEDAISMIWRVNGGGY